MNLVPMQLHTIPNFCGGRILTNFFYYTPDQFEDFFKYLISSLGTTANKGTLGMIVAFTNSQQKVAAGFLERLGFKPVATTDKYGNYDREKGKGNGNDEDTSPCVTFVGDWYYDVLPKIQEHMKELEAQRNTVAATSNLRRPAGPVTPAVPPVGVQGRFPLNVIARRVGDVLGQRYRTISPSARGANIWCRPENFRGPERWIHFSELRLA